MVPGGSPMVVLVLAFSGHSPASPAIGYPASNIRIVNNSLTITPAHSSACAFYADWNDASDVGRITVLNNDLSGFARMRCGSRASGSGFTDP